MKRRVLLSLLLVPVLTVALMNFTQTASSNSPRLKSSSAFNFLSPLFVTTFDVDRTDDTAGASACTAAPNDCSLRGAVIAANADLNPDPVVINLQATATYSLTISNATQENSAATGDLDINATLHSVSIVGGGSSGPTASIIDATGLNGGTTRDRVFQVSGTAGTVSFEDLVIQNGKAADDGTNGVTTNPAAQTTHGSGGCILNSGGNITLDNVKLQQCQAIGRGAPNTQPQFILDARGGALASLGSTSVIVNGSTLSSNNATGGDGPAGVNNNVGSNAKGGSLYFEGGTLNIEASRIENSSADGGNGGAVPQDGMLNGGFGGLAQGGGAWIGGGTVGINNSTFESTTANGGNSGAGGNSSEPAGGADGGGIYSLGNVTLSNSTFYLAGASGGDAGDAFGATCLGGHQGGDGGAARGGAVFVDGGAMIINTATFANNFVTGGKGGDGGQTNGACGMHGQGGLAHGGAIANANAGTINLKHGTLSQNNAQAGNTGVNQGGANKPPRLVAEGTGGGVKVGPGSVTVENTIIAGNSAANGSGDTTGAPVPGPNVDGTVTSNGHNLIGDATEALGFTGTGDLTGADPMLMALADNGGLTQTMALTPGSPAIDAGVASGSTSDQRGMPRPVDDPGVANAATSDGTDIGAFEAEVACVLECPTDIVVGNDADQCGAIVNYETPMGDGCGTVTCDRPSGSFFALGETTVVCTSTAGPTCNFKVTVNDTQGPTIGAVETIALWPPNHKYKTVNLSDLVTSVSDNCDATVGVGSLVIVKVTSDEADNSGGDGNTSDDIVIAADCKSVQLRSERSGSGNGRVYTITFKATDSSGNVTTGTAKVTVPKSKNGSPVIDDGVAHTVQGGCS